MAQHNRLFKLWEKGAINCCLVTNYETYLPLRCTVLSHFSRSFHTSKVSFVPIQRVSFHIVLQSIESASKVKMKPFWKENTCLQCLDALSTLIPHINCGVSNRGGDGKRDERILPHQKSPHPLITYLKDLDTIATFIPDSYCLVKRSSVQVVSPYTQMPHIIGMPFQSSDTFAW